MNKAKEWLNKEAFGIPLTIITSETSALQFSIKNWQMVLLLIAIIYDYGF